MDDAVDLRCTGLTSFPSLNDLPTNTRSLQIMQSSFSKIPAGVLNKRKKVSILILSNNEINDVDDGAFDGLENLFEINLDHNRLEKFPVFKRKSTLQKLYLNKNNIKQLSRMSLKNLPELVELELDYTHITEIPAYMFSNNTKLLNLNLRYSSLSRIDENAFTDSNLQTLLLKGTKITSLSSAGLDRLKKLDLEDVDNFWSIPPGLKSIREVYVSEYNSFLCCAFHLGTYQRDFAKQGDLSNNFASTPSPSVFSKSASTIPVTIASESSTAAPATFRTITTAAENSSQLANFSTPAVTTPFNPWGKRKRKRRDFPKGFDTVAPKINGSSGGANGSSTSTPEVTTSGSNGGGFPGGGGFLPGTVPPAGVTTSGSSGGGFPGGGGFVPGTVPPPGVTTSGSSGGHFPGWEGFLTGTVTHPRTITHKNTPNSSFSIVTEPPLEEVICLPKRDAYHPCEDIMGAKWLTVVSLMVGSIALIANLVVVIVMLSSDRRLNVHRFLMSNLAFADFCLGLYIFVLVCVSLDTSGEYYNHVEAWQYGIGCQITGFLAVFSTELSVYTLTVITIERFFAIVYAMEVNYRLSLRKAAKIMIAGWLFAFIMAILPLIGVNSYQSVAICLPFNSDTKGALAYVGIALVLNFGTFMVIAALYTKMFQVVVGPGPVEGAPQRNDAKVAKRMALLVFTDFVCWTPIALFGLLAAFGKPLIGVEESKFLLVFFFPLNSLCNPFLYAFFTKAFKREFFSLLSRFGFCHTRALRYKGTLSSLIYSRSRTKRSTIAEDDSRSKRISQISATSATAEIRSPGIGLTKANGHANGLGPVHEYIPMKGVGNPGFGDVSPVSADSDDVFFDPATKVESPVSEEWRVPVGTESPDWSNQSTPQILRAESLGSLHAVEGQLVEKQAKKPSVVSFRDDPQREGRK